MIANFSATQVTLTEFSAASTVSHVQILANALLQLSAQINIDDLPTSRVVSTEFVQHWSESGVSGVALVDPDGTLLMSTRADFEHGMGINVADRDYVSWAQAAKKSDWFLGKPVVPIFEQDRNSFVIPLATPMFEGEKLVGIVVLGINLSHFEEATLKPARLLKESSVFLISDKEIILDSTLNAAHIGMTVEKLMAENEFLGNQILLERFRQIISTGQSGSFQAVLPLSENGQLTPVVISFAKTNFPNQSWTLVVVTPKNQALAYTAPSYINQVGVTILAFLLLLLLAILVAKDRAYREGFVDYGRQYWSMSHEKLDKSKNG